MKIKPEYELELLIKIREELGNACDNIQSADMSISCLNVYSIDDTLKNCYKDVYDVMMDINKKIKELENEK